MKHVVQAMKNKTIKSTVIPIRLYFELYFNKFKKNIVHIAFPSMIIWLIITGLLFLGYSIFMSQNISFIYPKIVYQEKDTVVAYLKKIRHLSVFENELMASEKTYGESIKNEVFSEEISRLQTINYFEQLLETSPDSRDLLYGLYQLYLQSGDKTRAEGFLIKAKEIDPAIK